MARVGPTRGSCFSSDGARIGDFWLVRDYLPEFMALGAGRPTLAERAQAIGARIGPVPIPWDCSRTASFMPTGGAAEHICGEPVRRGHVGLGAKSDRKVDGGWRAASAAISTLARGSSATAICWRSRPPTRKRAY